MKGRILDDDSIITALETLKKEAAEVSFVEFFLLSVTFLALEFFAQSSNLTKALL